MNEKEIAYKKFDGLERLINRYADLMRDDYKASDIFQRITERMRSDPLFTATELVVGLCIAYDDKFIPIILREIFKFAPLVFTKLERMGLKSPIDQNFYEQLRELIKEEMIP